MLLVVRHGYQKLPRDPWLTGNEKQKRETAIREAKAIYRDEVWEKKNEVAINMKIAVSADRQTLSIPLHRAISMQTSTPILLALPNFMTKSKYLNFLAYALKTYWMRLEESARARRKEIRWTPSKVAAGERRRRGGERKRTFSIGSETRFYTERAGKKKRWARVENRRA